MRLIKQSRNFSTTKKNFEFLGSVKLPPIQNEPTLNYEPNSPQRKSLLAECAKYVSSDFKPVEVPCIVNGKEIHTNHTEDCHMPSKNKHKLFTIHKATKEVVREAIKGTIAAREAWENLPFEQKASIFLKAADLLSTKYRDVVNAATMMGQAKTMWQAEIDAACEMIDFWRFNVHYAAKIFSNQPEHHSKHVWNRLEYRGLEGFITAISPFNFSSIGGNLCSAPAQMGNVVIWKPSNQAALSNYYLFKVLQEAGLPDGVIQFLPCDPEDFGDVFDSAYFAGLHFTGSTNTFNLLWKKISANLENYANFPRIVGETGGKNFHLLHESADVTNFVYQTIRSAFEYQGQKCSACSRAYIPASKWNEVREMLLNEMKSVKVGQPNEPTTFVSSVIDAKAFKKVTGFIDRAKQSKDCQIIYGGTCEFTMFCVQTLTCIYNRL
jgi:1-pyrroline-5-carboxylate dehydrogenase